MYLEIKTIKTEEEFIDVGSVNITQMDVNKLNKKIRESVKANNDSRLDGISFLEDNPKRNRVKVIKRRKQ